MGANKRYALTTIDNPYDPFTQYSEWFIFDQTHGHKTSEILGRFAFTSDEMSDQEYNSEVSRAIDEIIKYDFENKYKKVETDL